MSPALRRIASLALASLALSTAACGAPVVGPRDPLVAVREAALHSEDGEANARWLLFELVAPGGSVPRSREARTRIDEVARSDRGLYPSIARGMDDEVHGELDAAAREYLEAVDAARTYGGPEASLLAWFATSRLLSLRTSVADLWPSAKPIVERAIEEPGHIGFRARGDLIDWWSFDTRKEGKLTAAAVDAETSRLLGCVRQASLAGPFGGPSPLDVVTAFDAERPGPWPLEFEKNARRSAPPRRLAVESLPSCSLAPKAQGGGPGVHYLETYLVLERESDILLAVQNAWAVLVDDVLVLERDPREFGSWPRFGVAVRLAPGRHRIVARLGSAQTTVRVLDLAGNPADVIASSDGSMPYSLERPVILPDPNALAPFLEARGVRGRVAWPKRPPQLLRVDTTDPILGFIAAQLVHVEGQDDLASVLLEPLVKDASRTPPVTLAAQADLVEGDPIFAEGDARDLALDLRTRAVSADARLWFPRLWLSLDSAQKQGPKDQLPVLAELALEFRKVPAATKALGAIYARLGYKPEHQRTVLEAAQRFPEDPEVLRSLLAVHDEAGAFEKADKTAEKLARIEPAAQIGVERALVRGDYARAIELLEADAKQADADASTAERARLDRRVLDLLVRAGKQSEVQGVLERALAEDPTNSSMNLSLADARFAGGDHAALRKALAHAIETGADTGEVRAALEVVDGVSELEAYRLDPRQIIAAFEKGGAAKAGLQNGTAVQGKGGGNAARVLDYAAIRIHEDGSARMLEHEILQIKSREAIGQLAEQRLPRGRLLKLRTIKADGRTFEPEIVQGKPTATMPHLELGDYIETETLYDLPSDGAGGRVFVAPRWFFREEKIDYDRSELIVISPKSRKLDIETTGSVPEPKVRDLGAHVERRWRVDESPALPEEPASAPITEFLPSVRVGWGVSQEDALARLVDASENLAPPDPRLVRIAKTIVSAGTKLENQDEALAGLGSEEKARRLYRWVLDNVEQGREDDPRRTVIGKSGSRMEAFLYLCRLVGVEARHAVVKDRLMPPPRGPISEAEQYTRLAAIIPVSTTSGGKTPSELWTIVDDKYAPFGYLPGSMRGQPAVVLTKGLPRTTTGTRGTPDGVTHHGDVALSADGSAKINLEQRYEGRIAIELREAIQTLPEDRLKDAIEAQLLPPAIPGARLISLEVTGLTDLDAPLVLSMKIEASTFARRSGSELILSPPFSVSFRPLAALEKRETPLLLSGQVAMRIAVDLTVHLPKGARVESALEPRSGSDGGRSFTVKDSAKGSDLVLERVIEIQPGRIQPEAYPAFVAFARALDEAIQRDLVVKLP